MPSVGVVVALPAEARTLSPKRLGFGSELAFGNGHWLIVSGAGPHRAHEASERLVKRGVRGLISWGCAGALHPDALPGDLFVSHELRNAAGDIILSKSDWAERLSVHLEGKIAYRRLRLQESSEIISKTAQKRALGQSSGAYAVDMESAAILDCARHHDLDFVAIRAIADHLDMALPPIVTRSLNPRGDVRLGRLLAELARKPFEIPDLIHLGRAFGKAAATLNQVHQALRPDFSL